MQENRKANRLKEWRDGVWASYRKMTSAMPIWDEMGREFKVDLEAEYKKWLKGILNPSLMVQHRSFFEPQDLFGHQKDLERFQKDREHTLRELIHKT